MRLAICSLIGRPILGACGAFGSGHAMNDQLLRALLAQPEGSEEQ